MFNSTYYLFFSVAIVIDKGQRYEKEDSIDITQRGEGYIVSHSFYKTANYRSFHHTAKLVLENFRINSRIKLMVQEFQIDNDCDDYLDIIGLEQSPLRICQSNYSSALDKEFNVKSGMIMLNFFTNSNKIVLWTNRVKDTNNSEPGFLIYYKGE